MSMKERDRGMDEPLVLRRVAPKIKSGQAQSGVTHGVRYIQLTILQSLKPSLAIFWI
jgi:hypothetical protein